MSAAPVYNRTSSFTNLQALNPSGQPPGSNLDIEFNNVKTTLDALRTNAALIQNDDGTLANASVGLDQLSTEVTIGFTTPTVWATATAYVSSPASTVFTGGKFYSCLVSHTSGTFATDLAASKWLLIADFTTITLGTASTVAVTPSGLLTTNVQTSLEALDSGKAATSHTHTASAISNSTAAGRNMLTAADVAAQQTLLGLGSLAYLSSVVVTDITANIALTGDISPAALAASTNDWAPTGWATSSRVRCSASSAINITGLLATTDGDVKIVDNIGSTNTITFTSQDAASSAANRIVLSGGLSRYTMKANESLTFIYDGTTARWRLQGKQSLTTWTTALRNASPTTGVDFGYNTSLNALDVWDGTNWRALGKDPTVQKFTSGTAATYTPNAGMVRICVRMVGGGGGGGAQATNNGTAGNASSFGTWTANGGSLGISGGSTNFGGAGGTGGTDGTGTLVTRLAGGTGDSSLNGSAQPGRGGGSAFFGGGGPRTLAVSGTGQNGATNTGGGGSGGSQTSSGASGGGGESVEFWMTAAQVGASQTYTVGAAANGGAAGTQAGGNGAAGIIIIEEFYS